MTERTYDAIVVGLGAMGSAALYQLARRGLRVLGLDAFQPGHQMGSSHGESRIIRLAYYEHPGYVPLLRRAYTLWRELEEQSGDQLLRITGGLMIGRADGELVPGALASAREHGLAYEMLTPGEVRRRYPPLHLADDEVAFWEPQAGFLRPERCIDALIRLAQRYGAATRWQEPVTSWSATESAVTVATGARTYTARQAAFTCGARMSKVLGSSAPAITAERATLFWMEPREIAPFQPENFPVYLWDSSDGTIFYGFPHADWAGVKVARHHTGEFCDPDSIDRNIRADDERAIRDAIQMRVPDLNGRVLSALVCMYENSADRHFVIDRLDEHPNVLFAGGFSGHGFKFASVIGEILADLVTRGEATPDAAFLRARRLVG